MNAKVTSLRGFRDSMVNFMSGLGTSKDKSTGAAFTLRVMTQMELEWAYRGDWMARKIVDIPADDATREWRCWEAKQSDISDIEKAERTLGIPYKVRDALQKARLYGGSVMVIGIRDDEQPWEPLNLDSVQKDSLAYVHVAARHEISAAELDLNVLSPTYGEPKFYEVSPPDGSTAIKVHPTRVLRFLGKPLPSLRTQDAQWSDSILQAAYDAIVGASQSLSGIAALIQEAKIDVVKIPGLMHNIGTADYRSRLTERFQMANTGKSIINTLILDKEEEWDRIQQTFNGLPDLMTLFLLIASGAADIPATRMLGQAPIGLNATGDSDLRNYYDNVGAQQKNVIEPILNRLDEVLIRSALGSRPDDIYYTWKPLWQMSAKEQADVAKVNAEVFQMDMNSGLFDPAVLKKVRTNQLIEEGTYPGLEDAMGEMDEGDEDDPEAQDQFERSSAQPVTATTATSGVEVPQDTALNGSQISSLLEIVKAAANKELPPETAKQLIMVGFPLIKEPTANAIIAPLATFEAPPPAPSPFGKPQPPQPDDEEEDDAQPATGEPDDDAEPVPDEEEDETT